MKMTMDPRLIVNLSIAIKEKTAPEPQPHRITRHTLGDTILSFNAEDEFLGLETTINDVVYGSLRNRKPYKKTDDGDCVDLETGEEFSSLHGKLREVLTELTGIYR